MIDEYGSMTEAAGATRTFVGGIKFRPMIDKLEEGK